MAKQIKEINLDITISSDTEKTKASISKNFGSAITEVLDAILEAGHGGGNWRRIITQTKAQFENKK